MKEGQKNQENKIVFLLKSMKKEYLLDIMTKGRFCFNHPTVFSQWENADAAQFDRWEGHDAYECLYPALAPIIGEENGMPIYGPGKIMADKAIIHIQNGTTKHTPICCFRCIQQDEIRFEGNMMFYSLAEIADRIMREFGHDAYVIIPIMPFLERLKKKMSSFFAMSVAYHDLLNNHQFDVEEEYEEIAEQLFRKDKKFEWQKEFRIALPPTKEAPVFIELGSIEDIAVCGDIADLKN